MEQILDTYYANNAQKLRSIVDKILLKFGGLSDKDVDDFYSLANLVFVDVMKRYDNSQSFDGFLYSCLRNKIKTEITRRNRNKRKADRMSISIDTPIGDDDNSTLGDIIPDKTIIEEKVFDQEKREEWHEEVKQYLSSLSPLQRKITLMLSDNCTPDEICKELHITFSHYTNSVKRIFADDKIKILRPLVERK